MPENPPRKLVDTYSHDGAVRRDIPSGEFQSNPTAELVRDVRATYERRNRDLDPQLVWRGKDETHWSDLVVSAPPLYIQENVHPKVLIRDLMRRTEESNADQPDLFAPFGGVDNAVDRTDFYQHDRNWTNRMILGDSLQVMASLAEREGLRGKVQCIYFDPPYGIKFNSNFQWSTTSRDVKDGKAAHITREPEMVKAFRDTWRDGIHSYMTYLRDRLTVARDLLTDSGSIFVQIGDENVHRVRALMDEVFSDENFVSHISVAKTTGMSGDSLSSVTDHILWYGKSREHTKYRNLLESKQAGGEGASAYKRVYSQDGTERMATSEEIEDQTKIPNGSFLCATGDITSNRPPGPNDLVAFNFRGAIHSPGKRTFGSNLVGMNRAGKSDRIATTSSGKLAYRRFFGDFPAYPTTNVWMDTVGQNQFGGTKTYVVQTALPVVARCLQMATDPGDLVLDPTCGSGTTATVAEQWGRRWITIDTSRVALTLARARLMGARYPFYLLADSPEGQKKEAEVSRSPVSTRPTFRDLRHGFVYERVPHITLKSIANNAEIDVIWERAESELLPLRTRITGLLPAGWLDGYRAKQKYTAPVPDEIQEWEMPRDFPAEWPQSLRALHAEFWERRIARQREIDASIAAKADFEFLYDKPYEDKKRVRVAGPFTVESVSPHRTMVMDENGEPVDPVRLDRDSPETGDFVPAILEALRAAGVQQVHKEDKINFESLEPWPGEYVCARGVYLDQERPRTAAVFIGPEFSTVSRADLVVAAREAAEAGFDVLVSCAFNYDAHASDFGKLGSVPVLKARMNADLHMAKEFKNTGKGNLFVVFGDPDVEIEEMPGNQVQVTIHGVDIFDPSTGDIRSNNRDGIACWFVDTDYNGESFFVRQAYFLGANDPYKALRTSLKAEIDEEAWSSLNSAVSRPFPKPSAGRIAVKVINHLGDEAMRIFRV